MTVREEIANVAPRPEPVLLALSPEEYLLVAQAVHHELKRAEKSRERLITRYASRYHFGGSVDRRVTDLQQLHAKFRR